MEVTALVVAIVAIVAPIVYAIVVDRRAQKSAGEADARAQRAQQTADDMSNSLGEIAQSLAALAAASEPGASGREIVARTDPRVFKPEWNIERVGRDGYVLRNVGTATATGVRVEGIPDTVVSRSIPDGSLTVEPVDGHKFLLAPTIASGGLPPSVTVTSTETGPVRIALPPR